ncbi:mediator of RNA polymerase II transcription subunit 25 [Rosa chinensis]|uniref:mediator of RNA polymerase II transcription subunit 25 n=1 Tax=Rosa chinensis TaxID=74649 RepID=UPI001AD94104|nr:mediator of RNA polymerase II transcription subunit 25 [Rosa chinensis]
MDPNFKPRRSPRIASRATVEQGGHEGAFGRFGEPSGPHTSVSVKRRPAPKGLKPLPASMQWKEDIYELAWEGTIFSKHQERLVLVSKAKAHKMKSAPESLTTGWPRLLKMGNVIPEATVGRSYEGQAHDLIFEITGDEKIYDLLNENELCIRFSLPTQSLIITPAEHNHFTGRVYAGGGPLVEQHLVAQYNQQRHQ